MATPRIERETVITFNEEEPEAMVWSASPAFQRHMARIGVEAYETSKREGTEESRWYRVPKGMVGVRRKRKQPELTEEQREERARVAKERFSKARKEKQIAREDEV